MFLRKVFLVLFVAILGTSWFLGEGFAAANPIVQYQAAPGYGVYGNPYGQPVYPNYQMQPPVGYYPPPPVTNYDGRGPLLNGWDAVHDWAQNIFVAGTGQRPLNPRQ